MASQHTHQVDESPAVWSEDRLDDISEAPQALAEMLNDAAGLIVGDVGRVELSARVERDGRFSLYFEVYEAHEAQPVSHIIEGGSETGDSVHAPIDVPMTLHTQASVRFTDQVVEHAGLLPYALARAEHALSALKQAGWTVVDVSRDVDFRSHSLTVHAEGTASI